MDSVPVLVAIGVTESGHKKVLGLQISDEESALNKREFLIGINVRGLSTKDVTLGIKDGLPGLERRTSVHDSHGLVVRQ